MCGIVGVLAYGTMPTKKEERLRQEAMIYLTTELLTLTQVRGKDATGLATLFADGDFMGLKMGISAQEFITRFGGKETDYDGYLNIWRKKLTPARIVIGHCRKPSTAVGAGTEDNNNNHPIKVGDIVGIHNGTLTNHEKIFTNLSCGRDSKVDSEAIFRLLAHLTNQGADPFTKEVLQETCMRLNGNYSVLAFNGNNPYQLAGFRDGRPMVFGLIKPLKLFLIASEVDFLKIAVTRYNKMSYLYTLGANKYPSLRKGDFETFTTVDDSLFLFDTTQEVTPETKIEDLFFTEKVPRNNKIWSKSTTTTSWQGNRNNAGRATGGTAAQTGAAAAGTGAKKTGTEVVANKPTNPTSNTTGHTTGAHTTQTGTATDQNSQGSTEHRLGMAFNRTSNLFEDVPGAKKTAKEHGAVMINIDKGEVTDEKTGATIVAGEKKVDRQISSGGSQHTQQQSGSRRDFSLDETERAVDDLITDPAKIEVAAVADANGNDDERSSVSGGPGSGIYSIHKGGRTTVIPSSDLAVDGDALEKALAATQEVDSFSTDDELADALEILDVTAMYQMPRYSLANRIKQFFFKKGWYLGYLAAKAEMKINGPAVPDGAGIDKYARTMLERMKGRMRRSQETIRCMKVLTQLLHDGLDSDVITTKQDMGKAVYDAFVAGKEINPEALERAFKMGDVRDMPMVGHAIEVMKEVKK